MKYKYIFFFNYKNCIRFLFQILLTIQIIKKNDKLWKKTKSPKYGSISLSKIQIQLWPNVKNVANSSHEVVKIRKSFRQLI